jgi:predicted NUDIX family NTP pyrophosphohydrolase
MPKQSAALLLYKISEGKGLEVLVAHMGGPFWEKKNARAWSIPKGEYEEGEEPRLAAFREFEEEIGSAPPSGNLIELGPKRQPSGKVITTYAIEGEFDASAARSNTFQMEWPKDSGKMQDFPEIDRAEWMTLAKASEMLVKGQVPIIEALAERLEASGIPSETIRGSHPSGVSSNPDTETLF